LVIYQKGFAINTINRCVPEQEREEGMPVTGPDSFFNEINKSVDEQRGIIDQ